MKIRRTDNGRGAGLPQGNPKPDYEIENISK